MLVCGVSVTTAYNCRSHLPFFHIDKIVNQSDPQPKLKKKRKKIHNKATFKLRTNYVWYNCVSFRSKQLLELINIFAEFISNLPKNYLLENIDEFLWSMFSLSSHHCILNELTYLDY